MTNKLFVTIYGNVGTNIQDTSTSTATVIKRVCNDAYREILRRVNWNNLNTTHQITTVAGTQDYILPSDFGKEKYVYDTTNRRDIPYISLDQLVQDFPDTIASTGQVDRYTTFLDIVRNQPSSASILTLVSSSAGDTSQVVRVKGTDSNDVELEESVSLTGTTNAVTTNTYKTIRSITKSAATTGRVTITSNGAAVTVAVLAPADLDYKVNKLRLHYIPSGVIVLNVPYFTRPYPLSNDYDVPVFDCADGIELFATAAMWRYKRQFQKAQEFERLAEKWLVDTAWDLENQPNQTHLIGVKPYPRDLD